MAAGVKKTSVTMETARFEELYDAYGRDVLNISYFYLHDRQKAEDVTQDVFLKLFSANPDLQKGKEKHWLMKVTLNRCRDIWRSSWIKRVSLSMEKAEKQRAPDRTDSYLDREEMLTAIATLSDGLRKVILLHYYQGYGVGEIGEILGIPAGTVSSRLSRARKQLGDLLKERE